MKKLDETLSFVPGDSFKELQKFFDQRPQLSANGFAIETGMSFRHLYYILKGERPLSEKTWLKLLPTMKKYGYGYRIDA